MSTTGYRLSEVIGALSHALDLTEGQPVGHAQRSCAIGMEMASRLGLAPDDRRALFFALLLKDAGCSSSAARMSELFRADDLRLKHDFKRIDWHSRTALLRFTAGHSGPGLGGIARAGQLLRTLRGFAAEGQALVETRCDRGARVVAMIGCPPAAAEAVRALDEHWDGNGKPLGLAGEEIPLLARIACLAQTAELFVAADGPGAAAAMVRARSGSWFDPGIAEAFLSISPDDPLWSILGDPLLGHMLYSLEAGEGVALADESRLDRVAEAFAQVIDAKSPFTARHSAGVAHYAIAIGERLGLGAERLRALRRAALLHDVGKLGVSNAILDKPGRLEPHEMDEIRRHVDFTEEILSGVTAFSDIVDDASSHHERIDGRGYHHGLGGDQIPLGGRILEVADIFEAMTADRPYRGAMDVATAIGVLRDEAGTGVDGDCLGALEAAVASGVVEELAAAQSSREPSDPPGSGQESHGRSADDRSTAASSPI